MEHHRRALIGGCLGNAVEWYDFAIYGAFSTILARVFFPPGDRAALAATFAIFAAAFAARLAGATVIGRWSDHLGRRTTLSSTIALMAAATAAVAVLPTWAAIGVLAPVSLLLLRMAQGFSLGGETPSSVAFLVESAPDGHRGRFGGWHTASAATGLAGGYGVALVFTAALSADALAGWGWRVAFLFAVPLGLIARYIRRRLSETPLFDRIGTPRPPRLIDDVLRSRGPGVARGFVLIAAFAMAFNLWFVFLPSYLAASGRVSLGQALACGMAGLVSTAVTAPIAGWLADRAGRRVPLIVGTVAIAAFAVPGFALARDSVTGLLVSDIVMGALIGSLVVSAFVAELFPTDVRATGVALTYGVASAVFGGTAPLAATLLTDAGALWVVPGSLAVTALLALAAAVTARETAFAGLA